MILVPSTSIMSYLPTAPFIVVFVFIVALALFRRRSSAVARLQGPSSLSWLTGEFQGFLHDVC